MPVQFQLELSTINELRFRVTYESTPISQFSHSTSTLISDESGKPCWQDYKLGLSEF